MIKQISINKLAKLLGLTRGRMYQLNIPLDMDKPKLVGSKGIKWLESKGYNCQAVWEYWSKGGRDDKD